MVAVVVAYVVEVFDCKGNGVVVVAIVVEVAICKGNGNGSSG